MQPVRKFTALLIYSSIVCLMLAGCADGNPGKNNGAPARSVRVVLPGNASAVMQNIASVFAQRVEDRCPAKVSTEEKGDITIELVIEPGIGTEGFRIEDDKNGNIRIAGNDQRGVLYGIGKFLRSSTYNQDGFTAGKWRGTSVPEKPVRGMYFATHFFNYYQNAPIGEIQKYIEDLGLWGVNSLITTFDMHQFNGAQDPRAVAMLDRLKKFMLAAKKLDIGVGFIVVGNEGYANSPVALRAEPGGSRGGNFPEVICPNKPGGMEYLNKVMGEYFDWARDIEPEYVCVWGYDQGGCGSKDCQPWGTNGFVKCTKAIRKLAQEKLPGAKIIFSTWYFDTAEWNGLSRQLEQDPGLADVIMIESPEFEENKLPPLAGKLPQVGFPEISMHQTFPWGGFGATPLTNRLYLQWQKLQDRLAGGFPYSEGIYEDMSKVAYVQLYWDPKAALDSVLAEYIRYEYAQDTSGVAAILKVVTTLEQNHHMRWWPGELEGVKLSLDWFPSKGVKPQADPGAEEAYAIVKKIDERMPEWARKSWRWRILFIRAMLDAELKANGGSPNEACIQGFTELMKIYHVTKETDPALKPPIPVPEK